MAQRVLGLDVGEKRVGVAVSDPLGFTAQGIETIFTKGTENDLRRVHELARQYDVSTIVVGLPRNMDGTEGFQAERVRVFADRLVDMGFEVRYQDERLTTASARRTLIEADVRRDKRKQVVDKLAAVLILQGYLDLGAR